MKLFRKFPLSLVLLFLTFGVAQATPAVTPRPEAPIPYGPVYTIAHDALHNVYIGGDFQFVGAYTGSAVPVDATTGEVTSTFPQVDGPVNAIEPDGNGGWYFGGSFSAVGDTTRHGLAHVLSDGSVDANWNAEVSYDNGNGVVGNGDVNTLVKRGDVLYIGGFFTSINGQDRQNLAALDVSTGQPLASWSPTSNSIVKTLIANTDGTMIYICGYFSEINGQGRQNIAALDAAGQLISWNPPQVDHNISSILLSPDGTTLYVGGYFTTIGGATRHNIAAFNTASSQLTNWDPNADKTVSTLAISSDGKTVYAGGSFNQIGGQNRQQIAALDTTINTNQAVVSWNLDLTNNNNAFVRTLQFHNNLLYVGGDFMRANNVVRSHIMAVDGVTGQIASWDPRASQCVNTIAFNGNRVYLGGDFASVGGSQRNNIASYNSLTGELNPWDPNADFYVFTLTLTPDGQTLYAGGNFSAIGGQPRSNIAALDITKNTNQATDWNPNADSRVTTLALAPDGKTLYAGGNFSAIGGQPRSRIAALDTTKNTNQATDWDPNADSDVFTLTLTPDGKTLYAGGNFSAIGGQPRSRVAALDTTKNTNQATDWDPNADSYVFTLTLTPDGKTLYAGGNFSAIGGQPRSRIAALDTTKNTNQATDWDPQTDNIVSNLALNSDGKTLYAGGYFTQIGGQPRSGIAALDTTQNTNPVTDWGPMFSANGSNAVFALLVDGDQVYVGGSFKTIDNKVRSNFAQFGLPPVCGNQNVEYGEVCDDGNTADGDYCSSDCKAVTGSCGDGVVQSLEECDGATGTCASGNVCVAPDQDHACMCQPGSADIAGSATDSVGGGATAGGGTPPTTQATGSSGCSLIR